MNSSARFPTSESHQSQCNRLPVFYLNLSLKDDVPYEQTDEQKFLALSEFADNVVKRRIEQLPEVAMADMTDSCTNTFNLFPISIKWNRLPFFKRHRSSTFGQQY